MGEVLRFERRSTYTGKVIPCRDCPFPATVIVFPRIDHRRRKPWPTSYGLCDDHAATGTETTDDQPVSIVEAAEHFGEVLDRAYGPGWRDRDD